MSLQFENYARKGNEFINHVANELNTRDVDHAFRVTRCVLHALRNRLTLEESFQMMAQLPMAIKAVYVDGWQPGKDVPRIKHIDDFLNEVLSEYGKSIPAGFAKPSEVRLAGEAVFKALARYVSAAEIKDVLGVLPAEMRNWLKESISA
jgi:uncharacterized protein (DUF2267 family)